MSRVGPLNRSMMFDIPMAQSGMGRSGMGSSRFYSSRVSNSGSVLKASRASNIGMSHNYGRIDEIKTSLKHDLQKSRVMEDEFSESNYEDLSPLVFSTSGRARFPQNDAELIKRAREAESLEDAMKKLNVMDKREQRAILMECVINCAYEFDNERLFDSNKKILLRSAGKPVHDTVPEIDEGEE